MPSDQHAWDTGAAGWEIFYAVVLVATMVLTALNTGSLAQHIIAEAALAALAVLYLAIGRAAIAAEHYARMGTVYLGCAVVLTIAAESQSTAATYVLFAVIPQCFMVGPLRRAIVVAAVLNLAPVAFLLEPARRAGPSGWITLAVALTGLAFSAAFGTWVSRIIAQSSSRAELIGRLEAAQAELAQVSREAGVLAERQRLAGEIHDTLAQGLTSIVMLLQAAEAAMGTDAGQARRHVGLAISTARDNLAEAKAMVAELTPVPLAGGTLPDALRRLADRTGAELGVAVSFTECGPARMLPPSAEVVLLRAGQEALANVRKHARASSARLVLTYAEDEVRLEITDDGAGFDPEALHGGYGLRGMRARILQAGGSVAVRAAPGAGTALTVQVPG
jgi:signal transduction histidine kinase